jgi:hypothetical protein
MALLLDFQLSLKSFVLSCGVGRHDLNPQNRLLFLRFKSDTRLVCHAVVIGEGGNSSKIPHLWMDTK